MIMQKNLLLLVFGVVTIAALVTVAQMWFPFMEWDTYLKSMVTLGIFAVLAAFGMVVRGEIDQHKKLKDKNYLD
jgi:hypothetical protein